MMNLDKRQIFVAWAMAVFLLIEFLILMFFIYFTRLPLFLFIFIVALKLLTFFFLGFTALFFFLTILGIKPELTLDAWKNSLKEFLRFFGSSFVLTCILIIFCVLLGALIGYAVERLLNMPSIKQIIEFARKWVEKQFY